MKNFKVFLLTTICITFLGVQNVSAQSDVKQQFITIKAVERAGVGSEMYVLDNNGEITFTELKTALKSKFHETFGENSKTIKKEIDNWLAKGYKIHTYQNQVDNDYNAIFTTIILVKD